MDFTSIFTTPVLAASGAAAIVIPFLVNLIKKWTGKRWAPAIAFILGAILGIAADILGLTPDLNLVQSILAGITIGGTSTGLYDFQKKTVKGK